MRTIWRKLRENRRFWPLVILGLLGFAGLVLLGGVYEYTNTPEFCGGFCHQMPPEYTAYQISPHARVLCVECHIGRGLLATQATRKIGDIVHVVRFITQMYKTPIHATTMRPAAETCERCHWPEAFHDDSVREIRRYAEDESNTETRTYLIMHTGGGTAREGLGKGIHWHIENPVYYIATDELEQDIVWVQVVDPDGETTDYINVTADVSEDFLATAPRKEMDCMTCHNRISHLFRSPQDAMDNALARRLIDHDIPYIKREGVRVLTAQYTSQEEALAAIATLENFYRESYSGFYAQSSEQVQAAVTQIQEIYQETTFPDMQVGWETHPHNIGHRDFPGCFRCHDLKHRSAQGEVISLDCNTCHSLPVTVGEGERPPALPLTIIPEPESHLAGDWMYQHRFQANPECTACHGDITWGRSGDGFCANQACHSTEWKWLELDAAFQGPAQHLIEILEEQAKREGQLF